jgi:tetratricopeptide (TPR) repeat protein
MSSDSRRTVSRRHLVRALLGREAPENRPDADPQASPHAAGDAAYAAGDYPAAVAAYRASIRGDLSNAPVRARLGHALYEMGQYIQARVEFEHVLRLTDGGDGLARLGLALTFLGLDKGPRAAAVLAAVIDPERPELERAAREAAARLSVEEAPDCADLRLELERVARATALLPESASA